jgi:hypothetical protein
MFRHRPALKGDEVAIKGGFGLADFGDDRGELLLLLGAGSVGAGQEIGDGAVDQIPVLESRYAGMWRFVPSTLLNFLVALKRARTQSRGRSAYG